MNEPMTETNFLTNVDSLLCAIAQRLLDNNPVRAYNELMLLRDAISNRVDSVNRVPRGTVEKTA